MAEKEKTIEIITHETSTSMVKPALAELDAGSSMALKVRVSCADKCDLHGNPVRIVDGEGAVITEIKLTAYDGTGNETDNFAVKAPIKPGEYKWKALFPASPPRDTSPTQDGEMQAQEIAPQETESSPAAHQETVPQKADSASSAEQEKQVIPHVASSVPFSFIVRPHATSMAVWDAPLPIVIDSKFKLKVGVRCVADCKLTGQEVQVYDQDGVQVATGILGDEPWRETTGLYWTEVEIKAPSTEGYRTWTAKFHKPELPLEHEGSDSSFASRTAKPPEHVVSVEVINQDKKTPIQYAAVALYSSGTTYRATTDEVGIAKLSVPKGEYELLVAMQEFEEFVITTVVAGDVEVKAELSYMRGQR